MSGKGDSGHDPSLRLEAIVSEDQRTAELRLIGSDGTVSLIAADAPSVEALIAHLDMVRRQMEQPVPFDISFDEFRPLAAFNPCWCILPDSTNQFATFWIRHPGLGWSGFGFPRHEAGKIAKWLRKVTSITGTRETQSSAATSVGGDKFLITTEGLGFYYYGKGETRIGPNPFEQIEFDSDRAAGIVAGSIAERRLEQAIQARLRKDYPKITAELFRPSGALGPFSIKINIALLMGLLTSEAHKDLSNLKNIRNNFAHELELDSFDLPPVRDRCKNFVLVDRHVGPIPEQNSLQDPSIRPSPYMGLPDHEQKLADPRFRYIMTAQLISNALGEAADHPDRPLPFV